MTDKESLIRTEKLSRTYCSGAVTVTALDSVDLAVGAGEFLAVTGTSGSGKSTLLNLLGGLDTPSSGGVLFCGQPLAALDRNGLARYRRCQVGMIFQSFNLVGWRTALENVELPMILNGETRERRRGRAEALLEQVGLAERRFHHPGELSGGEQQRVAVARALANSPAFLLADEPTGNLDSRTAAGVLELLAGLNRERGLGVLLVSHDAALALRFAGRRVHLADGRVTDDGAVS
jgi:putative ABC transport system ATP-binding protein